LRTFTIGMKGGTDLYYAKMVADFIGSEHTEINFTEEEGLNVIEDVIKVCETYDITTIRASVAQHLLAKWISENTDIKVVLNGDGSDENWMGYLYYHLSPDSEKANLDSFKLVDNIHYFDGLRVDRNISHFGLEARLPFLDKDVVKMCREIPGDLKMPRMREGKPLEKYLLRNAFDKVYMNDPILPSEVLFRVKEALSDAVSRKEKSWYQTVQEWIDINHSHKLDVYKHYSHLPPVSNESRWYREVFEKMFGENVVEVIPYFWLPNWTNSTEPSARNLQVYKELNE